jgi:hypothetical protein
MVKAHELAQTLRARSAERRVKADARAARLRARLPQASKRMDDLRACALATFPLVSGDPARFDKFLAEAAR